MLDPNRPHTSQCIECNTAGHYIGKPLCDNCKEPTELTAAHALERHQCLEKDIAYIKTIQADITAELAKRLKRLVREFPYSNNILSGLTDIPKCSFDTRVSGRAAPETLVRTIEAVQAAYEKVKDVEFKSQLHTVEADVKLKKLIKKYGAEQVAELLKNNTQD